MSRVLIAAIHNGELAEAPTAGVLDRLTKTHAQWTTCEISEQPPLQPQVDEAALASWATVQWGLEQQWRHYLAGSTSDRRSLVSRIGEAWWRMHIRLSGRFASRIWRSRQVEAFVTSKHLSSWQRFRANEAYTGLLVLESDAVWLEGSGEGVAQIMQLVGDSSVPAYVNIAGGFDPHTIDIEHLGEPAGDFAHVVRMKRAVTNTSCAYAINRSMAELLVYYAKAHPDHAVLGIDWLLNAAFLDAYAKKSPVSCWHAQPPVLGHGSLTGVTRSWHPDR